MCGVLFSHPRKNNIYNVSHIWACLLRCGKKVKTQDTRFSLKLPLSGCGGVKSAAQMCSDAVRNLKRPRYDGTL